MKNHNPNMCQGIKVPEYNGPTLHAVLNFSEGTGRRRKTFVENLSNPRKNDEAVLKEICARVKAKHPDARLISFERKEGRA